MEADTTDCAGCREALGQVHAQGYGAQAACQTPGCGAVFRGPREAPSPPRGALGDADRDLSLLARWLPILEGRAVAIEPNVRGETRGRADGVDERHAELARAAVVLARLSSLDWGDRLVLVCCYLLTGPETRRLWDGRGELWAGWDQRLGLVFASREERLAWLLNPARTQGENASRDRGTLLRGQAVRAYASAPHDPPPTTGAWLARARHQLASLVESADREARELRAVREQNRVAGKNRRERRDGLARARTGNTGNEGG